MENWRTVKGFGERYRISDKGRLKNADGKILKPIHRGRYLRYTLSYKGKPHYRSAHGLVLEAFVAPRPKGRVCRHLDGNSHNNDVSNLVWGTQSQNRLDCHKHDTMPVGEDHHRARLTEEIVMDMRARFRRREATSVELAEEYNVWPGTAHSAISGRTWSHLPNPVVERKFKLSLDDGKRITEQLAIGTTVYALAKAYGVSKSTIYRCKKRHLASVL